MAAGRRTGDRVAGDLPLAVVERGDGAPEDRGPSRLPRILRWIGLRAWRVPVLMAIVVTAGIVGLYFQPPGLQVAMRTLGLEPGGGTSTPIAVPAPVPTPAAPRPAIVTGLGRLLPLGDVAVVAPPSGAGDARIRRLFVEEGDRVAQGALVAVLDNEDRLEAERASARAQLEVAGADLERARHRARASTDEARAALQSARADEIEARAALDRTEHLFERNIAARAALDRDRATWQRARERVEEARATLSRYETAEPDAQPDVRVALRQLEAARAGLDQAERDLEAARVRAPAAGTVLDVHARPGEKPGTEGIVELGAIEHMVADIDIYQSDIALVRVGARVRLTADALPRPLEGVVTRIGLIVRRQSVVGEDPAASTDARVVEVRVTLDPASSDIAARFTNLQVRGHIEVAEAAAAR